MRRFLSQAEVEQKIYDNRSLNGQRHKDCKYDVLVADWSDGDVIAHISAVYAGYANITRRAHRWGLRAVQPIDKVYGQDMNSKKDVTNIMGKAASSKPLVSIFGIPCTVNSSIQNLNYYWRPEELAERRAEFDFHVQGMLKICRQLLDQGLHARHDREPT